MGRFSRVVVPGLAHHVTQRGNDRQIVFFSDDDRRYYLRILKDYCEKFGLLILAYCLMTNHVHLICIPLGLRSLALAVGRAHWMYSHYVNEKYAKIGHLWQNRFFSCPMDEDHRIAALCYVECNPKRAGIVSLPWLYMWSSAAAHCGADDPSGLLDLAQWRAAHDPEEWRRMLCGTCGLPTVETIRAQTLTGLPLGSDQFVSQLEVRLGRRLRPYPIGRPTNSKS